MDQYYEREGEYLCRKYHPGKYLLSPVAFFWEYSCPKYLHSQKLEQKGKGMCWVTAGQFCDNRLRGVICTGGIPCSLGLHVFLVDILAKY